MKVTHRIMHLKTGNVSSFLVVSIILLAIITFEVFADQTNQEFQELKIDAIKTEIKDGFCIGLIGKTHFSTNDTSISDSLAMFAWTTNRSAWITIPEKLEYAYQVELLGTNGAAMPKTQLGKMIGTKFFEFDSRGSKNGIAVVHLRARKIGEMAGAPLLFYPYRMEDLFRIDKPGRYTLQISFQILTFPRTGPNRSDYTNNLIRFSPLRYPLIKRELSTPTNANHSAHGANENKR